MRGIRAGSPALLLGLFAISIHAEDQPGRQVIASTSPLVPTKAPSPPIPASAPAAPPSVMLGRPLAGDAHCPLDSLVQPAAFSLPPAVLSAKGQESPLPMPIGTATKAPPLLEGTDDRPSLKAPADNAGTGKPIAATPETPSAEGSGTPSVLGDSIFAGDPWCGCSGLYGPGPGPGPVMGSIFDKRWLPCFWLRNEYLVWNISNSHVPPIVTTGSPDSLGVLGMPGTTVLFGGSIPHEELSGGRFTLGYWFDPNECCGLEGSFLFLGPRSVRFAAASNGDPVLARPFFDPTFPPAETAEQVANPALPGVLPLTGRVSVVMTSQFQEAEINGVFNCKKWCWGKFDWLLGFRYLRLRDTLDINEDLLVPSNSPLAAGQRTVLNDHFDTRNHFYGGQIGFRTECHWRCWDCDFTTKVGLGSTHEQATVFGSTVIIPAGGQPAAFTGGLFAQPTNIGQFSRDRFAVVPEVGINLGYNLTNHWRLFVGYSFIYCSTVARPGDQIDRVVNSTLIPPRQFPGGPARPAFNFKDTDFWAYGVNLGVELKY